MTRDARERETQMEREREGERNRAREREREREMARERKSESDKRKRARARGGCSLGGLSLSEVSLSWGSLCWGPLSVGDLSLWKASVSGGAHPSLLRELMSAPASIQELLLHRNVKRFRGGLAFKAHRLLYHSTLGLRVIKEKKKKEEGPYPLLLRELMYVCPVSLASGYVPNNRL